MDEKPVPVVSYTRAPRDKQEIKDTCELAAMTRWHPERVSSYQRSKPRRNKLI